MQMYAVVATGVLGLLIGFWSGRSIRWNMEETEEEAVKRLPDLLTEMMDYAVENGILQEDGIVYRDLFDTKIMSCLVGRPSEIIRRFHEEYEKSPEAATDFFYKFSQQINCRFNI